MERKILTQLDFFKKKIAKTTLKSKLSSDSIAVLHLTSCSFYFAYTSLSSAFAQGDENKTTKIMSELWSHFPEYKHSWLTPATQREKGVVGGIYIHKHTHIHALHVKASITLSDVRCYGDCNS